ncbi:MAG TPA: beta-ketoacyl synthase N-terminal-like domain-containing protein [Symbiobacteriaceae bacterium]|nr:beta-ketoacyl synthase N-terminal-like domain-containing protein [Symbiobacteriaceae bacterium]
MDNALEGIAVIAMSCRFPGARTVEEFWQNLCGGVEGIRLFTEAEALAAGVDPDLVRSPQFVKVAGALAGIEEFDAGLFGFSAREAATLDPQHRLFLELAWEALERAGHDPARYAGRIGVFAGCGLNGYLLHNLYPNRKLLRTMGAFQFMIGNEKDFLATRTSYLLNLKGPSISVQTACSTSLVAVCLACQSLLNYQSDMALAGGASVEVPHNAGYLYEEGSIFSPDGHCRPFDAGARGTVPSSGAGVVLLKRLEDAIADGDPIYAVIKGAAVNNDGSLKVGYTAPSVAGQAEVITEALALAGFDPDTISYVEAHGTATPLGDPVEVAALTKAFRTGTDASGFCALGSVKSNIGHTDAAAGVAGLIKTALALHHKLLPPSLHYEQPNPQIDFAQTPFYVNSQLAPWNPQHGPRRAGVSAFGIGGTNAHVVLEEAPLLSESGPSRPVQLLMLSARTPAALDTATANLGAHLRGNPDLNLADVAFTLQAGRRELTHRRVILCRTAGEAIETIAKADARQCFTGVWSGGGRPVTFLFPGQGAQYPNMARGLYEQESVFRDAIDRCAALLQPHLGVDLRTLLFVPEEQVETAGAQLKQTLYAQPALFAVEYALATLWMAWGVHPESMVGHSLGEYVAACLSGVLSLEDALALVAGRARLMQALPAGAMLAVPLPPEQVEPLLGPDLSLAAVNAPSLCVISGPTESVNALERQLADGGVFCRPLHTSHAFHSAMMEPVLAPFAALVRRVRLHPPAIPYISNLTGTWIQAAEATDPSYWVNHLRSTVRFAEGARELLADAGRVLLEVGPGQTLSSLAKQQGAGRLMVTSLRHPQEQQDDLAYLLAALGKLWVSGVPVDADGFFAGQQRRRVVLPTYPFERQRYWIDPPERLAGEPVAQLAAALTETPEATPPAAIGLAARPHLLTAYVEPASETERKIAALWQDLLGIGQVGSQDNFFELGGHSLLAVRLASRLQEEFGCQVTSAAIFHAPTVAQLAAGIAAVGEAPQVERIKPVPRGGLLAASWSQERMWAQAKASPGLPDNMVAFAYRLDGDLNAAAFAKAVEAVARRHEPLRTTFREIDGHLYQVIAAEPPALLTMVDLRHIQPSEREAEAIRLFRQEEVRLFDLTAGPLFRLTLIPLGERSHAFFYVAHTMPADGASQVTVLGELFQIYGALAAGQKPNLPERPIQYADYVGWEREHFSAARLEQPIAAWRKRLQGSILKTPLPGARRPAPGGAGTGVYLPLIFSPELGEALRQLARREGTTLFITMLAALEAALSRWTGEQDLTISTFALNRTRPELEGLIGNLANILPLRLVLDEEISFRELIKQVNTITSEALSYQEVPMARVLADVAPEIYTRPGHLTTLNFVFYTGGDEAEFSGLTMSRLCGRRVAIDLSFSAAELPEGLLLRAEYNSDLFEAESMQWLMDYIEVVVSRVTADPDLRLAQLPAWRPLSPGQD